VGAEVSWKNLHEAPGDSIVKLKSVRILSDQNVPSAQLDLNKHFFIELTYWNFAKDVKLLPCIRLVNNEGTTILTANNLPSVCLEPDVWYDRPNPKGLFRSVCKIPENFLKEGYYFANIIVRNLAGAIDFNDHVNEDQILSFEVIDKGGMHKEHSNTLVGVVQPRLDWKTEYQGEGQFPFVL